MRVHVIGTVLRVVLDREQRHGAPCRGPRQPRHHAAQGEIVVGHHRARREPAGAAALGVIARQVQNHEVGEFALPVPAVYGVREQSCPRRIRDGEVPAGVVRGGDAFQPADLGIVVVGGIRFGELPEVDDPQPFAARRVPEVGIARALHVLAVLEIGRAAVAIDRGPRLLVVIAREGARRPLMAVGADLPVHVKVVAQHPAPGEGVRVGSDAVVEDRERGVAVPRRDIPEHLVVGAVLADHVEHVRDGRAIADAARDRRRRGRPGRCQPASP